MAKLKRVAGCVGGGLLAAAVGCALLHYNFGQALVQLSYDLPYLIRADLPQPGIVLVYIDKVSREKYQLPSGLLDRRRHVELLQRLTRDRARMVFYDVVFQAELPDIDPAFAAAMREHGNVVIGGFHSHSMHDTQERGLITESVVSNRTLREAARHYGLLMVGRPNTKLAVRDIFTGTEDEEAAVWTAARPLNPSLIPESRLDERWLNFYGPTPAFPAVSFAQAVATNDIPSAVFRDKIVVIGSQPDELLTTTGPDKFATPWTRFGHTLGPGAEFLATSLGNLAQGNWLRRISASSEAWLIVLLGFAIGVALSLLRPWAATAMALTAILLITALGVYLPFYKNIWWAWFIPVGAQVPLALVWSVSYQYAVASRRERQMQKAFSSYLSPHLVKRIAASDLELTLGGKEVEATILFTDLEGFTTMAESLPPAEVSSILTGYFNRITTHILEHDGTIIKYIGDAVMAVWGAPLADPRQAERAVLAARGMAQASQAPFAGRRLRTRIGINTGKALAGNLGSSFRFDYTVIGATTNLASRLEALNKPLGTDILISAATREKLPGTIATRYLGSFVLRGTTQPTALYEVPLLEPPHLAMFEKAVHACEAGDLVSAKTLFEQIAKDDPPAAFYLKHLATLQKMPAPFVINVP